MISKLVGLHLRLKDTLTRLIQEAQFYEIDSFQFFLIKQKTETYITLSSKEKKGFLEARRTFFKDLFIHSSYWINPATNNKDIFDISKKLLARELRIAKALEVGYLVLHPGSAKGYTATAQDPLAKEQGTDTIARMLNGLLKSEKNVMILLENGVHGKRTIGNDLADLVTILNKLDYPEKVGFCLDTAHAFSYGYNLNPVDDFIALVDKVLGLERVKLIHLNDTEDEHGSMQDRHAFPGQGKIGKKVLSQFIHHPQLAGIPKIIEGPPWNQNDAKDTLHDIFSWK